MKAALVLVAALASSCEPPPREPTSRASRARVGYLKTADGVIPLEALFDPNTHDERVLAFRRQHDLSQLSADRELTNRAERGLLGGNDF